MKCRVTSRPLTQQVRKSPLTKKHYGAGMGEALKLDPPIDSAKALGDRLADAFRGEEILLPAHIDAVLALHSQLGDQRPATCGAYALSYLLPARGFLEHEGRSLLAEDFMAHLAAVTIEADEVAPSEEVAARVACGELTDDEALRLHPRSWYRFPISASADPVEVGTSAAGVARAVALATAGRLATVPIPGRTAGGGVQLDGPAWDAFLDALTGDFVAGELDVLFNFETDQLLGARDPAYNAGNLRRPEAASVIPRDSWGVGHFAPLAGLWRRPSGDRWLLLLNSFKERAFSGCEPQPAELMRRAVVREDGRGGGVLLIVPGERAEWWVDRVLAAGLEVRTWSNGSRSPADWRWSRGS